jgi:ankyrin repeat protein
MDDQLKRVFAQLRRHYDFAEVDFSDINACATDGDNGLHHVVRWGDVAAAKALIDAGIDINKAGDLCYTPLHVACMKGNLEMVKLLVSRGADIFALDEGSPPFTSARFAKQDQICEFLGRLMKEAQSEDPKIRLRSRLTQLQREIASLKAQLDG